MPSYAQIFLLFIETVMPARGTAGQYQPWKISKSTEQAVRQPIFITE
jgi:hypothetical protein